MMKRRGFLAMLSALPFFKWFRRKPAPPPCKCTADYLCTPCLVTLLIVALDDLKPRHMPEVEAERLFTERVDAYHARVKPWWLMSQTVPMKRADGKWHHTVQSVHLAPKPKR